ncbi:MAG: hypothetical protein OEV66_07395 [Spirochaetia bacterium]|nr:hypothetical protein [Spirochaetia bacterium]
MNIKLISLTAIFLWFGLIVFLGIRFVKGNVEKGEDGRAEVVLTKSEKVMILGEMRQLLFTVQGVVDGIEKNNSKAIAEAALNGGTKMMLDDNASLMLKLPVAFKMQGIGVHKYFDQIANEAQKGAAKDKILSMLNTQLQNCISCHAAYQFKVN